MKKLTAIFLFAVFLFNYTGYNLVYLYVQDRADKQTELSLDNRQYNESDLITLTVPLSMPYQTDQSSFERVDGEIKLNGKIYKYVKRKVEDGNLVLLCLPDYNKMRLQKVKEDFGKDVNGLSQNAGSKKQETPKSNSFKNILSEYDTSETNFTDALSKSIKSFGSSNHSSRLLSFPHCTPEQPPELV